ncbi:MAG: asparaginase [Gemmatimonadetes bacterium]|nr:asparaginase [Gemmatimonadota bacterium]
MRPGGGPLTVSVRRGLLLESTHRVHAVVADAAGRIAGSWGDAGRSTVLRSAAKPFQALPLVADGAADHFGLSTEEIALCCGSHNSEEAHLAVARSTLAKAGVAESLLVCGPHPPLLRERERELAAAGTPRTSIMSNCSGKHAGMLALAAFHSWPLEGYEDPAHPVQLRMRRELARWARCDPRAIPSAVDGCGVPTLAIPLTDLAAAMARLVAAAGEGGAPGRVVGAMVSHPFMVAGTDRLCTRLIEAEGGRVIAKTGAEGVYAAADRERGLGVAVKVEDGAWRAAPPALLAVLTRAGILSQDAAGALAEHVEPPLANTLGDVVGRLAVDP